MIIFRLFFAILISPIRWLASLFQHKDNLLEWHLNYGPSFVKIQTNHKEQFLADDLLIASYILFLARYFYICDNRQTSIVRDYLLGAIKESCKPSELGGKLYEVIFQTLNKMERDATLGLFKIYNRLLPIPPLTYSEDEEPRHSFAKYSFLVFERSHLTSTFHMSSGPDIILLPLTVGILYEYVVDKMRNKDSKEKLDKLIIDLLEAHSFVDCRSLEGIGRLPVEIISNENRPQKLPKDFKFSEQQIEEIKRSMKKE